MDDSSANSMSSSQELDISSNGDRSSCQGKIRFRISAIRQAILAQVNQTRHFVLNVMPATEGSKKM